MTPEYLLDKASEIKVEQEVINKTFNNIISCIEPLCVGTGSTEAQGELLDHLLSFKDSYTDFSELIEGYLNMIEAVSSNWVVETYPYYSDFSNIFQG